MGEEFAFGRIGPPYLLQQLHDILLLLFPGHRDFRDILMVSVEADARLFELPVRHAAAADINFPQRGVVPGVHHFGTSAFQHFLHGLLYHFHVVRLDFFIPVPVTRLRFDILRHAQEHPHGSVRIHPGFTVRLQFNGPDTGSGTLQNILQALPGLRFIPFLLLHHGIYVPKRKNRALLLRFLPRNGKMNFQIFKP